MEEAKRRGVKEGGREGGERIGSRGHFPGVLALGLLGEFPGSGKGVLSRDFPLFCRPDLVLIAPLSPLSLFQEGRYVQEKEFEGQGVTPYDPYHNSSFVISGKPLLSLRCCWRCSL